MITTATDQSGLWPRLNDVYPLFAGIELALDVNLKTMDALAFLAQVTRLRQILVEKREGCDCGSLFLWVSFDIEIDFPPIKGNPIANLLQDWPVEPIAEDVAEGKAYEAARKFDAMIMRFLGCHEMSGDPDANVVEAYWHWPCTDEFEQCIPPGGETAAGKVHGTGSDGTKYTLDYVVHIQWDLYKYTSHGCMAAPDRQLALVGGGGGGGRGGGASQ